MLTRPLTRGLTRPLMRGLSGDAPVVVTISGDAYAGSTILVDGGEAPYEYVINSVDSGVFTDDPIPLTVVEGDSVQVKDANGVLSNVLVALDALTGISFALRLQSHLGDGTPLGLYQDVACTIPALEDGDQIAAWRDEISGNDLILTQADGTRMPTLRFVSGNPVVRFDGSNDFLSFVRIPISNFSLAIRQKTSGDSCLASDYNTVGDTNQQFLRSTNGGLTISGNPNGVDNVMAGNAPVNTTNTLMVVENESEVIFYQDGDEIGNVSGSSNWSHFGAIGCLYIQSVGPLNAANGDISSVFFATSAWDANQISRITNYAEILDL